MTGLRTFEYTPDLNHSLVKAGAAGDLILSKQCPVLVGKLREIASKKSSTRLFLHGGEAAATLVAGRAFAEIFGDIEYLPESIRQDIQTAGLFLALDSSVLAQRYLNGTLEPELHVGNETSREYALGQLRQEEGQTAEPIAEESDADYQQPSLVNSASDGIA